VPELPEVETIRRFLEPRIVGLVVNQIDILTPKSFIGNPQLVEGQKIISISRLGKQLSLHLGNQLILHFHLKMTGQVVLGEVSLGHPTPNQPPVPNKSTRVVFTLSDDSRLYFNDQRKFGWVKVLSHTELVEVQHHLGRDILDSSFTLDYFSSQLHSCRPIKLVLLDQSRFAGIGNIYANDALFLAKTHPLVSANTICGRRLKNLWQSVLDIISQAVSHQGSTASDNTYVLPDGSKGSHQYYFKVYQRAGQLCLNCFTPIIRIVLGGRGTFFCPQCQKL